MNWYISLQELKLMTGIEIEVALCRKWEWSGVYLTGIEMRSKLGMSVSNWDRSWVYLSGFEIEVGSLTGIMIKILAFQLVAVIKRYSFKSCYTYSYVNEIRKQNADSTYSLQIALTICGFDLQFADSAYSCGFRNSSIQIYTCLVNCSGFRRYGCGFSNFAYFWSDFERYSVYGICFWNPKQQRRWKKSSNVADSATNFLWACCGIRLQWTVWPLIVLDFFHDAHLNFFLTTKVLANWFSVMLYLEELFVTQDLSFLEILLFKKIVTL